MNKMIYVSNGKFDMMDNRYSEFLKEKGIKKPIKANWIENRRPHLDPAKYCEAGERILMKSVQCGMTNIRYKIFVDSVKAMLINFESMTEEVEC